MTEKKPEQKNEKKKVVKVNTKYPLPGRSISLETQLDLIKAFVVVSKNGKEPVNYNSFKSLVDLHPTIISGNNEFFENIGLIKEAEGKRGYYLPNEQAIRLSNSLKWDKKEEIKSILQELLTATWFWKVTKQLLYFKDAVSREELLSKLGHESEADPQRHTGSLSILIDYMIYCSLIKEQDGKLTSTDLKINQSLAPITTNCALAQSAQSEQKSNDQSFAKLQPLIAIIINPDMSEEQIRKSVRTILDEWKKLREESV